MKEVIKERVELLQKCYDNPQLQQVEIELCKRDIMHFFKYYTYTDKNTNLYDHSYPTILPFIPYEFQEEYIKELWSSIYNGTLPLDERTDFTNVFVEKSRQMGLSWLTMAVFVYGFVFHNHKYHVISQKETDVDKIGDMRSLFEKCRFILSNMPKWMLPEGYTKSTRTEFNKYMSLSRSDGTGSITGESANPNASRSGTYNAIFLDEMAFMSNASTINTAAAAATPCRIFNSTPNGEGNEFYRMRAMTQDRFDINGDFKPAEIKGLRYHWSDHPMYTDEWYKWKIRGMTEEKIAQELEIDYATAVKGRVYKEFPKVAEDVQYDQTKPLYIAIDNSHGGNNPNAIICIQVDGVKYNIIDAIEISCGPLDCAHFLTGQPKIMLNNVQQQFLDRYRKYDWRMATFISDPYDTKSAMGNSTILDDYRSVGINLMLPEERKKEEQIMKTRTSIYKIRYNEYCKDFASAIMNARYPEIKEDSNRTTASNKPVHDWTSHFRTALEYFVTYIHENPPYQKKEILIDKRPKRNLVTGELYVINS